ncbi:hypothetical protein [Flavobacterium beibuense]|uniref:hypothetical protein n=1 Tax=Flavobacterium beibuense TaxID=657326 RepID=UPI003A942A7B
MDTNQQKRKAKLRTMMICLSDVPEERIINHQNGKRYLPVTTYDYDQTNEKDEDFKAMVSLNKDENAKRKTGEKVDRIYIGSGKIWNL